MLCGCPEGWSPSRHGTPYRACGIPAMAKAERIVAGVAAHLSGQYGVVGLDG